jgi:hypothetical protein
MKTRFNAYYQSIPGLDRQRADLAGAVDRAPSARGGLQPASRQPSVLEALHPDIVQAITLLWGYPEMNQYFEKLWLDDGTRSPIAPEAMSELMLLAGVHRWLAPQLPARTMASIYDASHAAHAARRRNDIWDDVPPRR